MVRYFIKKSGEKFSSVFEVKFICDMGKVVSSSPLGFNYGSKSCAKIVQSSQVSSQQHDLLDKIRVANSLVSFEVWVRKDEEVLNQDLHS